MTDVGVNFAHRWLTSCFLGVKVALALRFAHSWVFVNYISAKVTFIYQHSLVSKRFEWLSLSAAWLSDVWPDRWASCFLSGPELPASVWSWKDSSWSEPLRVILAIVNHFPERNNACEICRNFWISLVIGEDISFARSLPECCCCWVRLLLHHLGISLSYHLQIINFGLTFGCVRWWVIHLGRGSIPNDLVVFIWEKWFHELFRLDARSLSLVLNWSTSFR